MQSISDKVLKGMSAFSALRLAVSLSGRADDEIAAAMNWSPRVANRIFSNDSYWPSFPTLPRLCAVLGNDILARWVTVNAAVLPEHVDAVDAPTLVTLMGELFGEMGDVAGEGRRALEDGSISELDVRRILRELRGVLDKGAEFMGRLQANLEQA